MIFPFSHKLHVVKLVKKSISSWKYIENKNFTESMLKTKFLNRSSSNRIPLVALFTYDGWMHDL